MHVVKETIEGRGRGAEVVLGRNFRLFTNPVLGYRPAFCCSFCCWFTCCCSCFLFSFCGWGRIFSIFRGLCSPEVGTALIWKSCNEQKLQTLQYCCLTLTKLSIYKNSVVSTEPGHPAHSYSPAILYTIVCSLLYPDNPISGNGLVQIQVKTIPLHKT